MAAPLELDDRLVARLREVAHALGHGDDWRAATGEVLRGFCVYWRRRAPLVAVVEARPGDDGTHVA